MLTHHRATLPPGPRGSASRTLWSTLMTALVQVSRCRLQKTRGEQAVCRSLGTHLDLVVHLAARSRGRARTADVIASALRLAPGGLDNVIARELFRDGLSTELTRLRLPGLLSRATVHPQQRPAQLMILLTILQAVCQLLAENLVDPVLKRQWQESYEDVIAELWPESGLPACRPTSIPSASEAALATAGAARPSEGSARHA